MPRFNDSVRVTPETLRLFSGALKQLAQIQERQAEAMMAAEIHEVSAKNLKTALKALAHLGKFIGAATTAFCDEISEDGIEELEGAVLQFRRYLKRGTKQIEAGSDDLTVHDAMSANAESDEAVVKAKRIAKRRPLKKSK